ncbi:hypothetical protein ACFQS3_02650 [Glycomyces mayteni]|uniref:Major tail protein n=1 Tax=Glycomyces mayteni TaxID=543887 RepID=A0ABW2D4T3_9ACTN|nr:hypothetical protein GCM10025732_48300 [Glycomyces mayteni]
MAFDANEVRVAITGEVKVAPVGTAAPTTYKSVLDPAFKGLGYNNDEGVVESYEESTESLRAWQNNVEVRTVTTESDARLAFTLIQTNKSTLELFHKGSVIVSDGGDGFKLPVIVPTPDPRSFVFDVIDGDEHIRIYAPVAEVIERGEIEYVGGGAVSYNVTLSCKPIMMTVERGNGPEILPVPFLKFSGSPAWGPVESA